MKPAADGGAAGTARRIRSNRKGALRGGRTAAADPRVLVFACNWCSYAGADTAGVSRLQQNPHFRLLRVMCSGRVHPAFVLRAFAQGADGVMVSGCHFGDCHYMFGNHRAVEQFEKTQALARLLGLQDRRLRLEWVSAAEGVRFAELMNEFVEQVREVGPSPIPPPEEPAAAGVAEPDGERAILTDPRTFTCLECGRCTGVCPVARYQAFSPRRLISRALSAGGEALVREPSLWACLTCRRCQAVCPTGVDYDRFILAAREAAVVAGASPLAQQAAAEEKQALAGDTPAADTQALAGPVVPCSHGGVFEQISLMMSRPGLRQQRLGWLTDDLEVLVLDAQETETRRTPQPAGKASKRRRSKDLLYVGCSPYFAAYFGGETGEGLTATMRSAVRLLNRSGITPTLLGNERCCGYHLRMAGRTESADALERRVLDQIRRSGATRVITFCPECLVALRQAAGRHGATLDVVALSTLLWGRRDRLRQTDAETAATAAEDAAAQIGAAPVTYQDPCRLGRYARIYDAPRDLLTELAGSELTEMAHNRANAICCGNTAWLNCNAGTKRLQTARLSEAVASGSERLLTACPGCYIHLRCAQEGMEDTAAGQLPIEDLWNYLARTLPPVESSVGRGASARERGANRAAGKEKRKSDAAERDGSVGGGKRRKSKA